MQFATDFEKKFCLSSWQVSIRILLLSLGAWSASPTTWAVWNNWCQYKSRRPGFNLWGSWVLVPVARWDCFDTPQAILLCLPTLRSITLLNGYQIEILGHLVRNILPYYWSKGFPFVLIPNPAQVISERYFLEGSYLSVWLKRLLT